MTIIASFQHKGYWLLVGDLLLSGIEGVAPIQLPTRFHEDQPATPLHLVGLCQKVVCIDDSLAVAWSGHKLVAQHLIRRISRELSPPYSSEQILRLIYDSGLAKHELDSVSFIFFGAHYNSQTDQIHQFIQDYLTGETILDEDTKVKYAGSGQYHFLECLDFKIWGSEGSVTEFESWLAGLIARIGYALISEIGSEDTHNYSYGGGFEIVCLDPYKRIAKVPLTFVCWKLSDKGPELIGPILAFNYPNRNLLLISRLTRSNDSREWQLSQFTVADLLESTQTVVPATVFNLDTYFVLHYFIQESSDTPLRVMLEKGDPKSVRIYVSPTSGLVEVEYSDEFLRRVSKLANH